jgi:hypothetical protein
MKILKLRGFWLIAGIIFGSLLISSCEKEDEVADRSCTVTFIQNLTNAAGDSLFVTVQAGEMIPNPPALSREGFRFDGWYTNAADANPNPTKNTAAPKFPSYDITVKPIYLDMILYARWIK